MPALRALPIALTVILALAFVTPRDVPDVEVEKAKIRALAERYEASWNRADADGLLACYADPYVDVNAPRNPISLAEQGAKLRQSLALIEGELNVTSDEIRIARSGDFAVQRGEFTATYRLKSGGPEQVMRRRYVEFLTKGDDGRWKVAWGIDGEIQAH